MITHPTPGGEARAARSSVGGFGASRVSILSALTVAVEVPMLRDHFHAQENARPAGVRLNGFALKGRRESDGVVVHAIR
jgi:hypothetical protein